MSLWGGRFQDKIDDLMKQLNDSFRFDRRLYAADIRGSVAYAGALSDTGLLTDEECQSIIDGLEQVRQEFNEGSFQEANDEDIHTAVERRLTEIVGPAAGKLHTGRSRNDQVATDLRLWLIEQIGIVQSDLAAVQAALIDKAEGHLDLIMPGYTHLQPAQPVLFSHWLMSVFWAFDRDQERLDDCKRRTAVCPLGSGALSGTPFPIDRTALAAELGMPAISPNSMDAVSDRDFVAEFLFAASLIGIHISRLAEDLIIMSGPGRRFVTLGEQYTTGSSLMPQKRNPDSLELVRGKTGRILGALVGLLTVLKGLPSTYNKDLQEDKEPLFDTADTLAMVLPVLAGVIGSLVPSPDAMRGALDMAMLATDLADYLVDRGVPFREAHHITGHLVRRAEEQGITLDQLPLDVLQAESAVFDADAAAIFDFERAVSRRAAPGGTAPETAREQIAQAHKCLVARNRA
ncbi:MAG: argininosuccinate lyase [Anaerolineae bacterium]|nr:argininosuccinate lyase [Anaerolineae bacterium]